MKWHRGTCFSIIKADGSSHFLQIKPKMTHRIHGAAIYGDMDPINKNPRHVSIFLPAPWIRHGL